MYHVVKQPDKVNFMTPSNMKQIITIHILPNISRSEDNETTKFGQSIDSTVTIFFFFFKNHAKEEVEKLIPNDSLFIKKKV